MANQRFRWNLLFNLLIYLVVPLPFWLPFVSNTVAIFLIPAIQWLFVLMWLVIAILALRSLHMLYKRRNHQYNKNLSEQYQIEHVVLMCCYKEPVDLIARSLESIASQTEVRRTTAVVAFERKTPDVNQKCAALRKRLAKFPLRRVLFTIHPLDPNTEIPGKCSNSNHGLRELDSKLREELGDLYDPEKIIVTTCDADSQFHNHYLEALTECYVREANPTGVIYQAPLLYNWGLDKLSFVTRATSILRATLMMGGLIPFNINTMSIFSHSLKLCIDGDFVHPLYQMDDIICLIRWMGVTRRRIRICKIPVPVLSGPTSGSSFFKEVEEWARQARRWTIGAAEVFHYYVVKASGMPVGPALSWGLCFLSYYGILLCTAGLYGITAGISYAAIVRHQPLYMQLLMAGATVGQMLAFLGAFIVDAYAPRLMDIKENVPVWKNVVHFILTPVVLIAYSLVELYALTELAIYGKQVCKHGASKKDALSSVVAAFKRMSTYVRRSSSRVMGSMKRRFSRRPRQRTVERTASHPPPPKIVIEKPPATKALSS